MVSEHTQKIQRKTKTKAPPTYRGLIVVTFDRENILRKISVPFPPTQTSSSERNQKKPTTPRHIHLVLDVCKQDGRNANSVSGRKAQLKMFLTGCKRLR